ncbi:MAG: glycosyltransferase [Lachnospiraceae bacterium]|nr:glycosyltransferase [Lachnospiraceae bacterium]
MSETVSVIVPVYNSEKYVGECVDSILSQTYEDLEVILTDDGSKDTSGKICDEYAASDKRVRVIHKQNGGLSSARNAGLEIATGEYVLFVDSDDSIEPDTVEKLITAICRDPEVSFAFCDIQDTRRPELTDVVKARGNDARVMDRKAYQGFLSDHQSREYVVAVVAWNKLFKRHFIDGLLFPVGKWHEDEFFVNAILSRMNSCVFLPERLYRYRENEEGITGAKNRFDVRHLDVFDAYSERVQGAAASGDREFAEKTSRNGFDKLLAFYVDAKGSDADTDNAVRLVKKKYAAFYKAVCGVLSPKRKLKFLAGVIRPELLLRR